MIHWFAVMALIISNTVFAEMGNDLIGNWFRRCWVDKMDLRVHQIVRISEKEMDVERFYTTETTCAHPQFKFTAKATYSIAPPQNSSDEFKEVLFTWVKDSIFLQPLTQTAADGFNKHGGTGVCNRTDWAPPPKPPKNVSGLKCSEFKLPKEGESFFQIFKVSYDGNDKRTLQFGYDQKELKGDSEKTRPTKLEPFNPFVFGVPSQEELKKQAIPLRRSQEDQGAPIRKRRKVEP